jgi:SAM-dependent methyltransferase
MSRTDQTAYWMRRKNRRAYDHEVVETFAEQRIRYLARRLDFTTIHSAFDYGCGDGFSSYYMARHVRHVEGGDPSAYMLQHNPLPEAHRHLLVNDRIPFPDNAFDLVYCWEVLHHAEEPERIVNEMARVASKYVVVFEPNGLNPAQWLFGLIKREERGTWRFRTSYMMELARRCDLRVIRVANVGWIFPNMTPRWLCRVVKRLPFEAPLVTISTCLIAEKKAPAGQATGRRAIRRRPVSETGPPGAPAAPAPGS